MTLNEAIKHAEEVAVRKDEEAFNWKYDYDMNVSDTVTECETCADEHRQLAEWLKDYKRLLEQNKEEKYTTLDTEQCKWWVNTLFNMAKEKACNSGNFDDGEEIQAAQDKIIKALEQQPNDKTIKYIECNDIDVQKFTEDMKKQRLQVIKPNIWIPVSEKLPEDRNIVLVTAYWHETYQVMMASYFGEGLWWCVPFNNCGDHMQKLNPKAWQPLPKAYEERQGSEK